MLPNKRDIRFIVITENSARQAVPFATKYPGISSIYFLHSARNSAAKKVIQHYDPMSKIRYRNAGKIFTDMLNDSAMFILPLDIGHGSFQRLPNYGKVVGSLDKIKGRIYIMCQNYGTIMKVRLPKVHGVIVRSVPEYFYYTEVKNKINSPTFNIFLVGELGLNMRKFPGTVPESSKPQTVTLFCTYEKSGPSESRFRTSLLKQMLKDLDQYIQSGKHIKRILIKDHPETKSSDCDHHVQVRKFASKRNIEIQILDKMNDEIFDICRQTDLALVQSTFSCHIYIRQYGIPSFLYIDPRESTAQTKELLFDGLPTGLTLGKYVDNPNVLTIQDNWIKKYFIIDGHAEDRLIFSHEYDKNLCTFSRRNG